MLKLIEHLRRCETEVVTFSGKHEKNYFALVRSTSFANYCTTTNLIVKISQILQCVASIWSCSDDELTYYFYLILKKRRMGLCGLIRCFNVILVGGHLATTAEKISYLALIRKTIKRKMRSSLLSREYT